MKIEIKKTKANSQAISLPRSKSISNRLLIMQALSKKNFEIVNLSNADDTLILQSALESNFKDLNVGMAGTAFRFLTAYQAIQSREVNLLGHARMYERPIKELVESLKSLGANIKYINKDGFPPLNINGLALNGGVVTLNSSVSSQFISALLLIAPYCKGGIQLNLEGELVSEPYIRMTILLMQNFGVEVEYKVNRICVSEGNYSLSQDYTVEADWSSAAFFYQYFACSDLSEFVIIGLQKNSIQGDFDCTLIFEKLGVKTVFLKDKVLLKKIKLEVTSLEIDLTNTPDLIPSFSIAAALILNKVKINGVKTLRIKESNRVRALKMELEKIGIQLNDLSNNCIELNRISILPKKVEFNVYQDHRLAMCFAILSDNIEEVTINNSEVVSKSFPEFWEEFKKLGFDF